jgi:ABC-type phosphate/phosphonate transport system substrate-binding protein
MYDLPSLAQANETFLRAFRALLQTDGVDPAQGSITQICGYPLQTVHRGQFALLGAPCHGVPGCDGPAHRAFIVVAATSTTRRLRDLRGSTFAVNSMDSNTGMNLPRHLLASFAQGQPFLNRVIVTGSHRASMAAVAGRLADAAAIDCVTFGLHAQYEPATVADLRVIGHTSASPSIPFVTPRTTPDDTVAAMRRALARISDSADFAPLRSALRIERIDSASEPAYDVLLDYHAEAAALGYPEFV